MKATRHKSGSRSPPSRAITGAPSGKLAGLRARLADAEETLRAIRTGEVDTVMVAGKEGSQVFTLKGAEHAYRVLIESMNEGALTLAADKTILFANQCFAKMVKCPLERVTGSSFRRFLSTSDCALLQPLVKRANKSGAKIQVQLIAGDGSRTPAQISIRSVSENRLDRATISMVVTDMTEARRTEGLLRALTHRVVQAQEAERGRVALELHDSTTQLLCAVLFRSQALVQSLSARDKPAKREAQKLCEMLAKTAEEVERISRDLRPSVLDQLGLVAMLRVTAKEFATRTGVPVKLTGGGLPTRLPADVELTFFRILQEALKNVEQHARARHVSIGLKQRSAFVQLSIKDDGVSFDLDHHPARRKGGLGLLSMQERATYAGGTLTVRSDCHAGTEIEVRIPFGLKPNQTKPNKTKPNH